MADVRDMDSFLLQKGGFQKFEAEVLGSGWISERGSSLLTEAGHSCASPEGTGCWLPPAPHSHLLSGAFPLVRSPVHPPPPSGTLRPRQAAAEAVLLGPGLGAEGLAPWASLSKGLRGELLPLCR